jgi:hypothetical protein
MYRKITPIVAGVGLLLFGACTTAKDRGRDAVFQHQQYLDEAARTTVVDASDGISEIEAYKIGLQHFGSHRVSCGYVSIPKDEGDSWRVVVYIGLAPLPVEELLIRKSDGFTTDLMGNKRSEPNKALEPTPTAVMPAVAHPMRQP